MDKLQAQARAGNQTVMFDGTAAPDIVYVVRPGESNEALRYSLRSLANLPHGRVFITGYKPSFIKNVNYLYRDQSNLSELENVNRNIIEALNCPEVSEDFYLFNDDFYIMKPVESIPPMHQGNLQARIDQYRTNNRYHQAYSLIKTQLWLNQQGFRDLFSYELHSPILYNKTKLRKLLKLWPYPLFTLRLRTCYGNAYQLNGAKVNDAKDSTDQENKYISSGADFANSPTGQLIRSSFPAAGAYE